MDSITLVGYLLSDIVVPVVIGVLVGIVIIIIERRKAYHTTKEEQRIAELETQVGNLQTRCDYRENQLAMAMTDIARVRIRLAVERDPKSLHLTRSQIEKLIQQLAQEEAKKNQQRDREVRSILGVKKLGK